MLCRGFTLLEVALSTVVVAVLFVGAVNAAGGARMVSVNAADRIIARRLAEDLMAEITACPIGDLDESDRAALAGELPERTEIDDLDASPSSRSSLHEIKDLDQWTASPPVDRDGQQLSGIDASWRRACRVSAVSADVVRIAVYVTRHGRLLCRLECIRTRAGDELWKRG